MAKPVYSTSGAVNRLIDYQWNGNDISYSFPMTAEGNRAATENPGFVAMTSNQIAMAREAFELWDDLIAPNLNETTGWGATITMGYSTTTDDGGSYAAPYDNQSQIWFSTTDGDMVPSNVYYSQPGMWGYLHEIGHALGLDHPGPYNAAPGVEITFDKDAVYQQDTFQYSVMSYFKADDNGSGTDHTITVGTKDYYIYAATPLLHDIAAIQWTYGADLKTRTGDTVYGFNNTSGRDAFDFSKNWTPVVAIWDAGGRDTLDLSLYGTRQVVDLRPGAFSSIGDKGMTNNVAMSIAVDSYGNIQGLHAGFSAYNIINYIENAKGGYGSDKIVGNDAQNELHGNSGDDELFGLAGTDQLYGGLGNDTLDGGLGGDFMQGGAGNDVYFVDNAGDGVSEYLPYTVRDAGGIDEIRTTLAQYTLNSLVENLTYLGTSNFVGTGNGLANVITGGLGNDTLSGLGGNDTLNGGSGNDVLDGGVGADAMFGGAGNDVYYVDNAGDRVVEGRVRVGSGGVISRDDGGIDEVKTSLASYTLSFFVENLTYTGSNGFTGVGNELDNVMRGGAGADTLEGGLGNDTFIGGRGFDKFIGGAGNDTYHLGSSLFAHGRDTVVEAADGGTDTVIYLGLSGATLGHTLAENVENLTITGSGNVNGGGNALDNVLIGNDGDNTLAGNDGNDTLDGGAGYDILKGGAGNDTYRVTSTIFQYPDDVIEDADGGIDTVIYTPLTSLASITPRYTLTDNVENLTIKGALDADGTGNGLDNILVGNEASNTLSGLDGNDTLDGGLGFDTLEGGEGDDTLVGAYQYSVYGVDFMDGGTGSDTADFSGHGHALWIDLDYPGREVWTRDRADVDTGAWRQVADLVSVENLVGTAGNDRIWGNGEANLIVGRAGDDRIDGRGGNDILSGGFANESDSRGDDGNDIIDGGLGDDLVIVSYGADIIDGGADTDTISFAWVGADLTVDLGLGTTAFREGGGYQTEFGAGGWSSLVTVTWTEIENLIGGLGNDILSGNAAANRIEGGEGADTIDGGAGDDMLDGGIGADAFAFADGWNRDTIGDFADGEDLLDMRQVSGLWSLDQLAIESTADGAEIAFAGDTVLLRGVDAAALGEADFLFAAAPEGRILTGTDGDDVLAGGLGADQFFGLAGSDVLNDVDGTDTVDGGDGYDYVYAGTQTEAAGFRFTVAGTNVEYVNGGAGNDVIDASGPSNGFIQSFGDAGDDVLIGGDGEDWIFGGMGADTAVFSGNRADYTVLEDAYGWTGWTAITHTATGVQDWIISVETLQFADMTVEAPSPRQELKGDDANDVIAGGDTPAEIFGLAGDDQLAGGAGNDMLYGGVGADTLSGGDGSDVLFIANDDTVFGGEGYDFVWADDSKGPIGLEFDAAGKSIEFVWGGMGDDVIDASGVSLSAFDWGVEVSGNAGDDVLIGSLVGDSFVGGDGNDTMVFAGDRANYAIAAPDQYGNIKVTDAATGVTDWLYGVETVKFADGSWML